MRLLNSRYSVRISFLVQKWTSRQERYNCQDSGNTWYYSTLMLSQSRRRGVSGRPIPQTEFQKSSYNTMQNSRGILTSLLIIVLASCLRTIENGHLSCFSPVAILKILDLIMEIMKVFRWQLRFPRRPNLCWNFRGDFHHTRQNYSQ